MKDVNKFLAGEYIKGVKIPKTKLNKQIVIAPVGLIKSGKTTVTKLLTKKIGAVRISSDEVRVLARDSKIEIFDIKETFFILLNYFINKNLSVVADAGWSDFEKREALEMLGVEKGFEVVYIKINPPRKYILDGIKNFKYKKGELFRNSEEVMRDFKRTLKERWPLSDLDYIHTFNPAKENLSEQVGECVEKIKSNLE